MNIIDLLKSIEVNELLDFLVSYTEHDNKFGNALKLRFGNLKSSALDFDHEVEKIADMVDDALSSDNKYYRGSNYIDFDSTEIDQEIRNRVEQGYIRLAFAQLEVIYRKLLDLYELQEECEISDEAENYIAQMAQVAEKAIDVSDQEYIFDRCLFLCGLDTAKDYGADYEDRFLKIASQFVTQENRAKFDAEISKLNMGYPSNEIKLIQLNYIRRLEGDKAGEAYIAQNLESSAIRTIAYDMAMADGDYSKAEELCLSAPNESKSLNRSMWLCKLLIVYEKTERIDKQAEVCEQLLLQGDIEYYNKLKELLIQLGRWEAEYQTILEKCEKKIFYSTFMEILDQEKDYDRLMVMIRKHPEKIFIYGKKLSSSFFDEVSKIFTSELHTESTKVNSRDQYAAICTKIRIFAEAGYALQANTLIDEYKLSHKRQPAFVDELKKLGKF
ncbi:MAG: hypothetical protein LBV23_10650 [Deltaproteobacteria bacterium]|jgi:hypothetical protein|nr:hypothetical protein [Deltaproteobacteria bacterium]